MAHCDAIPVPSLGMYSRIASLLIETQTGQLLVLDPPRSIYACSSALQWDSRVRHWC